MKLVWWNMQRLGAGTDEDRKYGLAAMLGQFNADLVFACEVLKNSGDPPAISYGYRKSNPFQLCYSLIAGEVASPGSAIYTPNVTDCYRQGRYKGGNDFTKLCSRAPGKLTLPDGVDCFFFHAPASNNAVKTLAFLACDLNAHYGRTPWLLLGDFNVEPDTLSAAHTGIAIGDLVKPPDRATHRSGHKLDYALSNMGAVTVTVGDGGNYSDHEPIIVQY